MALRAVRGQSPDDITRGMSLSELAEDGRWKHGPPFLQLSPHHWSEQLSLDCLEQDVELKQSAICGLTTTDQPLLPDPQQYNTLHEFLTGCAHQLYGAADPTEPLSPDSYRKAE